MKYALLLSALLFTAEPKHPVIKQCSRDDLVGTVTACIEKTKYADRIEEFKTYLNKSAAKLGVTNAKFEIVVRRDADMPEGIVAQLFDGPEVFGVRHYYAHITLTEIIPETARVMLEHIATHEMCHKAPQITGMPTNASSFMQSLDESTAEDVVEECVFQLVEETKYLEFRTFAVERNLFGNGKKPVHP